MTIDLDAIEARANAVPFDMIPPRQLVLDVRAVLAECARLRENAAEHQRAIVELATVYNARDEHTKAVEAERDERTRQHAARGSEAVAVIDELRATLANERGEGEGPSEGWTWDGNSCVWLHGLDADGEYPDDGWTVEQTPAGQDLGWTWEHTGTRSDPYPYAREAMRAADSARSAP